MLETGQYRIQASKQGYVSQSRILHVNNGELLLVNFELAALQD